MKHRPAAKRARAVKHRPAVPEAMTAAKRALHVVQNRRTTGHRVPAEAVSVVLNPAGAAAIAATLRAAPAAVATVAAAGPPATAGAAPPRAATGADATNVNQRLSV